MKIPQIYLIFTRAPLRYQNLLDVSRNAIISRQKVEICVLYLKAHVECQERAEDESTSDPGDDEHGEDDDDDNDNVLDNEWAFAHIGGSHTNTMSSALFRTVADKLGTVNLDESNLHLGQRGNKRKTQN